MNICNHSTGQTRGLRGSKFCAYTMYNSVFVHENVEGERMGQVLNWEKVSLFYSFILTLTFPIKALLFCILFITFNILICSRLALWWHWKLKCLGSLPGPRTHPLNLSLIYWACIVLINQICISIYLFTLLSVTPRYMFVNLCYLTHLRLLQQKDHCWTHRKRCDITDYITAL